MSNVNREKLQAIIDEMNATQTQAAQPAQEVKEEGLDPLFDAAYHFGRIFGEFLHGIQDGLGSEETDEEQEEETDSGSLHISTEHSSTLYASEEK